MLRVLAAASYPGDERALFRQGIGAHVRPAETTLTQRIHQVRQPLFAAYGSIRALVALGGLRPCLRGSSKAQSMLLPFGDTDFWD